MLGTGGGGGGGKSPDNGLSGLPRVDGDLRWRGASGRGVEGVDPPPFVTSYPLFCCRSVMHPAASAVTRRVHVLLLRLSMLIWLLPAVLSAPPQLPPSSPPPPLPPSCPNTCLGAPEYANDGATGHHRRTTSLLSTSLQY